MQLRYAHIHSRLRNNDNLVGNRAIHSFTLEQKSTGNAG